MNQGLCGNEIGVAWRLAFPILDSDANALDLRPACRCVYHYDDEVSSPPVSRAASSLLSRLFPSSRSNFLFVKEEAITRFVHSAAAINYG